MRFPRCHSSTIIALPDGSLLAAWWNGSQEGWSDVGSPWDDTGNDLVIRASRRPAEKMHWEPPCIIADTPDTTDSNPLFLVAPGGSELWFFHRMGAPWFKLMWKKSTDLGHTWSKPEIFWDKPGYTLRSSILTLSNEDIFIPVMTYTSPDHILTKAASAFIYSADRGKSWKTTKPIITEPHSNEPTAIQRSDGSLLAYLRPYDPEPGKRFLWQSESFDRGRTWSKGVRTAIKNPSCAAQLLTLRNGHVVLAFNDSRENRSPLNLALSLDDGHTWSYKRTLEDAPGRFSYPTLTQSADGHIHVSYTFRRTHIKHAEVNEAWIMEKPW
ncbi:MAG: sialidase family protein [Gemmatimonadota bacterium]|nr:sialidase family protein [Gemmatimonadota bacterium]